MKLKKHFDIIIANPPYGSIGAKITKAIIDKVDFNEYYNLMPANDYKRVYGLWNYISRQEAVNKGFEDAAVTTHIADIRKDKVNKMSSDEYAISCYLDPHLTKYFIENLKRVYKEIDEAVYKPKLNTFKLDKNKCFLIGKRWVADEHIPYTKDSVSYHVNVLEDYTAQDVINRSAKSEQKLGNVGDFSLITFNTEEEKKNAVKFIYSKIGLKFTGKIFLSINADSYVSPQKWFPKVDWTKSWTAEEILRDYKYTDVEIEEVMEDLKNYNGMKD